MAAGGRSSSCSTRRQGGFARRSTATISIPALKDEIADALAAVDEAFQAAKDAPGEASATRLAGELNALISGPPTRLDVAISDAARDLSLERLVGLMDEVRAILGVDAQDARSRASCRGSKPCIGCATS